MSEYYIYAGQTSTGIVLNGGDYMHVLNSGTANSTTVNLGGSMTVSSGGNAFAVKENGGYVNVENGADVTFSPNTFSGLVLEDYNSATVHSGTTADYTSIDNGAMYVYNGGTANHTSVGGWGTCLYVCGGKVNSTNVNENGSMVLSFGGVATNTVLKGDSRATSAYMCVSSGSIASNTTVKNYGSMCILSGGKISGTLQMTNSSIVSACSGAIIDFTVADQTTHSAALVNDWSLISGGADADYTITVKANQSAGTYVLAGGAAGFSKTVTVKTANGITLGTLDVGGSLVRIDETIYSLNRDGGNLSLTIATPAGAACDVSNYNNTAKSDILHVAADGSVFVMRDTAEGYKWSNVINNITGWKLGEARRDVTGDGLADVQITCDAGNMTYVAALRNDYLISGDVSLNYYLIGGYDNTQWNYIGSADVDGDGKSEVMMAQTEAGSSGGIRHVAAWVTNDAGQWVGNTWVGGLTGTWNVTGTADVDGNGTDNVILCRADGMIGYWSETGSNQIVEVWNAGGSTMLTSGNFAGNDTDGILWTNVYGDFFTWNNIATGLIGERIGNLSDLSGSWAFGGVGDYNGDGKDDILWRNTATGTLAYGGTTKETFANLVQIA